MATKIQIRRDTAANWTSNDPVLSIGEQGFETDTNKMKIGDGVSAWSALAYMAGGAGGLELQAPTSSNEYYIYVGNPTNQLAQITDTRGNVSTLTYDQSFATLVEATEFIQANTINEIGYSVNRDDEMFATYVIALEESVTHAFPASGYISLGFVRNQIVLINQNSINPTPAGSGIEATIGAAASDQFHMQHVPQIQIGGDLIFNNTINLVYSHVHWFYNTYNSDTVYNGNLKIREMSRFYTDGTCAGQVDVERGSWAAIYGASSPATTKTWTSSEWSYLDCGTLTNINLNCNASSVLNTSTTTLDSTQSAVAQNNARLFCTSLVLNGNSTLSLSSGSEFTTSNAITGTSVATNHKLGAISKTTADVIAFGERGHALFEDGCSMRRLNQSGNSFIVDGLPTVDPADGGKSFWLNSGVMTLSS